MRCNRTIGDVPALGILDIGTVTSGLVSDLRYRLIYLGLGVALIAVVVFAVVLSPDAPLPELPEAVEAITPADGDTVLRQTDLTIDMAIGYEIEVFIDSVLVPASEFSYVEPTAVWTWVPGPGKRFEAWEPGLHSVLVRYERVVGGVDIGEHRWVFRVQ